MAIEIFTYSNGDVAMVIFNAIAALFASEGFGSMISVCALFAIVATGFHFFIKRDHNNIIKWAAVYFAVPLLLINTTTSVQITDLSDPTGNYRVDNVPAIVAYPTAWSSHYMHATTQLVEDIFHVPNDEQYSRTGMMFGAKLYRLSRQSQIENSELKGYWQHYLSSCIQGDILLNHKYTWKQLADAPDIWAFLASHSPSPLRAIQMGDDDYPVCKDALPRLKRLFEAEANHGLTFLGQWVFGNSNSPNNQAFLNSSLTNGYQRYANISKSASQITLQNMTINATREGLMDSAAVNNNTAAAFNYAYTQNKMQTTSMWAGMALQAREFLPMLQSILFLLFGCVAFLVVAIAMLPQFTFLVLGNYIKGFIYLGTWPVMFALINFIMTTRLSLSTTGITDIYNGITLSNVDPLQEMHARWAAMTGFLMMSVPILIVPLIMKGGAAVMSSMSHQFAGMMNSVNARTSASAASGDINLGNAQVDNYNYNNTHANKLDTAGLDRTHGFTRQDSDGFSTTTFDSGKQVISGSGALSNALPINVSGNEVISHSLSQSASDSTTASKLSGESLSQSMATANSSALSQMSATNHTSSYGSQSATGDSGSHNKGFSDMSNTLKAFGETFNKSEEESFSELFNLYVASEAGVKLSSPLGGVTGSSVSASVSTGAKGSTDESDTTRLSDSEMMEEKKSFLDQFTKNINTIKSFSSGEQASDTHNKTDGESETFLQSLNESITHAQTQQAQLAEAQSYTEAANSAESSSLNIGHDLTQNFVEFVQESREKDGFDDYQEIIKGTSPEHTNKRTELLESFGNSDEVKAMAEQYKNNALPQSHEDIVRVKQEYEDEIDERKQQTHNYLPSETHQGTNNNAGRTSESLYQPDEKTRIEGLASQGVQEIRADVLTEERQHTPARVPTIDKEQVLADAEAEHAIINTEAGKDSNEYEQMIETLRKSRSAHPISTK